MNCWAIIGKISFCLGGMKIAAFKIITLLPQIFRCRGDILYTTRLNTDIGAFCLFSSSPKCRVYLDYQTRRTANSNTGVVTSCCCFCNAWGCKIFSKHLFKLELLFRKGKCMHGKHTLIYVVFRSLSIGKYLFLDDFLFQKVVCLCYSTSLILVFW